ncbi:hypothetical protein ACOSP7_002819 [Xanthoceras sorbifolium]|uniref:Glycine-rich protein n=1 Tax=Xanthoceras sorbifolium TaxID=99658 RepID=A0ABQ8IJ14_9ROSI|nr:hypothetical protein JRO89_XS01G0127500 [Xanthoceras sorbifolium]
MASSKTLFLLVCVLSAFVLLVSSEAASDVHTTNDLEEGNYGGPGNGGGNYGDRGGYHGRGCPYGCCRRFRYRKGCDRCCRHANEAPDAFFAHDVKN